jgi:hypothetical protein
MQSFNCRKGVVTELLGCLLAYINFSFDAWSSRKFTSLLLYKGLTESCCIIYFSSVPTLAILNFPSILLFPGLGFLEKTTSSFYTSRPCILI